LQKMAAKVYLATLLYQIYYLKSTNSVKPVEIDERIGQVIFYIGEHIKEELTLDSLAERFALNKNHLNAVFQKVVGTPLMKYVTAKRLGFAQQEILSGIPLGETAYNAGFKDYTTFFRAYKSFYGCSPSETRVIGKNFTQQESLSE